MEPRISYIAIGVTDLARARAFYEGALGFPAAKGGGALATYELKNGVLALLKRDALDAAVGSSTPGAGAGAVLVHAVRSKDDVTQVLSQAESGGGRVTRAAGDGAWGGYSGAFSDPDGNRWIVLCNPDLYRG